jgi:hypothetical protein
VPNEHAENTGTRKRRNPKEAPALDSLENEIRRFRPFVAEIKLIAPDPSLAG